MTKLLDSARWSGKVSFLRSYMKLGYGLFDRLKLLGVAWKRFEVYTRKQTTKKTVHLRLEKLGGGTATFWSNDVNHLAVFEEIFSEELYDFSKVPFKPDLVVDCGAHVGFFSLLAAHHWPGVPILAFEPDPSNAGVARENFARNKLSGTVLPAAVGKSTGWACFDSAGGMGHLSDSGGLRVPVIDLPKLLASIPSERCVIKMDIEGAEMELLPEVLAVVSGSAAVLVELHSGGEDCLRLERECAALGFSHTRMRERIVEENGMHFVDSFMIRNSGESGGSTSMSSGGQDGRAD